MKVRYLHQQSIFQIFLSYRLNKADSWRNKQLLRSPFEAIYNNRGAQLLQYKKNLYVCIRKKQLHGSIIITFLTISAWSHLLCKWILRTSPAFVWDHSPLPYAVHDIWDSRLGMFIGRTNGTENDTNKQLAIIIVVL